MPTISIIMVDIGAALEACHNEKGGSEKSGFQELQMLLY
jgi:hypothetical protein